MEKSKTNINATQHDKATYLDAYGVERDATTNKIEWRKPLPRGRKATKKK